MKKRRNGRVLQDWVFPPEEERGDEKPETRWELSAVQPEWDLIFRIPAGRSEDER